ncbi:MAG: GNAT family N-acetyltransferase [Alphaproteobacteria bacterium]|nr:GNAT family N-acetyltransferase [Alphaproteobacteria bacterium]
MLKVIKAQPEDAAYVVSLMYKALGDYADFLMASNNPNKTISCMEACFKSNQPHQLHYSNCLVAVMDNEIIGEATCYAGNKIPAFNKNLSSIIAEFPKDYTKIKHVVDMLQHLKEADADEYYMDTLSIQQKHQHTGIGHYLLQAVYAKAAQEGFSKLSIVVQYGKEYLLDYYIKQGFFLTEDRDLGGINYHRLLRTLQ